MSTRIRASCYEMAMIKLLLSWFLKPTPTLLKQMGIIDHYRIGKNNNESVIITCMGKNNLFS